MNLFFFRQCLSLVSLFLAVASCGPVPQAGGGIGGTGSVATVSSGPITKFGSVFVSGTEYDNSKTIYCIDDDPCSSENRLKLGMIVLVNGRTTENYSNNQSLARIANTITFEETVEGVVESVAADGLSLVVLGQVVHVNQETIIDASISGQSIANLRPNVDHIEVSGFVVTDGHILATLIMMQSGTPHYEVQGTVKNHDSAARTFEVGTLRIDYSTIDVSHVQSQTPLQDGVVVHVRGDQWNHNDGSPSGGTLIATRVAALNLGVDESPEAELEGFILRMSGPGEFVVNNLRIQTVTSTAFEEGTMSDLTVDAHVIVHGRLTGGTLKAEQISFAGEFELESNVLTIDRATRSLTLAGLPGMTVFIDNRTAIDGEGNLNTFEGINAGDHLHIHGRSASGGLRAIELERSDPGTQVRLIGPAGSISGERLVIGGTTVDTSNIPNDRFIGSDGSVIGRSAFFQNLTASQKVSLNGTWTGSTVRWTSARLQT